jgi:hypothetical protein
MDRPGAGTPSLQHESQLNNMPQVFGGCHPDGLKSAVADFPVDPGSI